MEIDNNDWKSIHKALDVWKAEGKLTEEQAQDLKNSFSIKKASQQIAQYFFLIALSCTLLAFGAIFIDERLLETIKKYFSLSNLFIAALMAGLAIGWFIYVMKRTGHIKTIAYEIYMVLGGLSAMAALVYVCKDYGFGRSYTGFLIIASTLLLALSAKFRSLTLWIGGLLAFMGWYGAFGYVHSRDFLFLGMNYPVRFTLFGLAVVGISFLQGRVLQLQFSRRITFVCALIIFFTGFWGVSIFGNYNHLDEWYAVRQTHVIVYSILFGCAAMLSLYLGIKYKDDVARDLGILFLLLNFYSRYFEYFWNTMHKGIFFLLLAVSFWFLGKWIEKRRKSNPTV